MCVCIEKEAHKKSPKNEKLRNTHVTIHPDDMHLWIQVTKVVCWLYTYACYLHLHNRQIAYNLLTCTCAYGLDEQCVPQFFNFFAIFPKPHAPYMHVLVLLI